MDILQPYNTTQKESFKVFITVNDHIYEPHVLHNISQNFYVDIELRHTPKFLISKTGKRFRKLKIPTNLGAIAILNNKGITYLYPKSKAPGLYKESLKTLVRDKIVERF